MDAKAFLAELRAERNRIDNAIAAVEALSEINISAATTATDRVPTPALENKRVLSAAGKKRIIEANRKRWAAVNAGKSPAKSAKIPAAKKPGMSEATKKRLSELAKKRWAARKVAAKKA